MATPTTRDELFELIRKSGVLKPDALQKYLAEHPLLPAEPKAVVSQMIQAKMLTQFQAKLLLAGRYKGFRLGAYILLEQLGQGGMGAVYLAEHETLHRKAAIKVLPPGGNKITVERFLREARAVAALDHPNIVRMHDVGREGEVHFLVMEYVEGQTLDKLVTATAPLPAQRAVEFVSQACAGLQHAHERGFIHRDIKPANLILAKDGTVKILDMGLARSSEQSDQLTAALDAGAIVGTADYISPEQAMNDPDVDIRTDIYSLGATFFAIVTGRPPFDGHTASKLLQHQVKDAPSVTSLDKTFPPGLSAVIAKMMAKKPDDRYATPSDVITALQPWQNESAKLAAGLSQTIAGQTGSLKRNTGKITKPPKKKSRAALYAVLGGVSAAVLLGIGITVAMALSGNSRTETKTSPPGGTESTPTATATNTEATKAAPATKPAPPATKTTPPTTKPTIKPPDPIPVVTPSSAHFVFDATTIPEFRCVRERQKTVEGAEGKFPSGIYVHAYKMGARSEFRRETFAGKPVIAMENLVEPMSGQMVFDLEDRLKLPLTPDKRYIATIEYATAGTGSGIFNASGPSPKFAKLNSVVLPPTMGKFQSKTFSFVRSPSVPARLSIDVTSMGIENSLYINRVDLVEDSSPGPKPEPSRVVYKLELGEGKPVTVTTLTSVNATNPDMKSTKIVGTVGEGQLPPGWQGRSYMPDAECETEIAIVDGQPALGVRTTKAPDSANGNGSAILFSQRFECPSGVAKLKFEYQTMAKPGKCGLKIKLEGQTATDIGRLTTPTTGWEIKEVIVDLNKMKAGVIEISNASSIGDTLWIRNYVITEATPADLKKK